MARLKGRHHIVIVIQTVWNNEVYEIISRLHRGFTNIPLLYNVGGTSVMLGTVRRYYQQQRRKNCYSTIEFFFLLFVKIKAVVVCNYLYHCYGKIE